MTIPYATNLNRFALLGLVAALVSACASQPKPEGHDILQNHSIKVASEQVSIAIALPQSGLALAPGDANRFHRFLREYVSRGRTVITIESAQPSLARDLVLSQGLRDTEIYMAPSTTVQAPNAVLTFTANKAVSPECGDWSSSSVGGFDNAPHSNFGCATQRNIGQMVVDPGDFIQAKPAEGKNAARTDADIFKQEAGTPRTRLLDGGGNLITGQ